VRRHTAGGGGSGRLPVDGQSLPGSGIEPAPLADTTDGRRPAAGPARRPAWEPQGRVRAWAGRVPWARWRRLRRRSRRWPGSGRACRPRGRPRPGQPGWSARCRPRLSVSNWRISAFWGIHLTGPAQLRGLRWGRSDQGKLNPRPAPMTFSYRSWSAHVNSPDRRYAPFRSFCIGLLVTVREIWTSPRHWITGHQAVSGWRLC